MSDTLIKILKRVLPRPLAQTLRNADNYRRRLLLWRRIRREVTGATARDEAVLRRAIRSAPLTSLKSLALWQDPVVDEPITIAVRGGGRFEIRPNSDDLHNALHSRDPAIIAVLKERLRPGGVFVDAGANLGMFSVIAGGLIGPEGKVLAFEMMPETAAILRRHFAINGTPGQVIEKALSDESGHTISASYVPGHFGMASIARDLGGGARHFTVPTTTLDEELRHVDRIAVMKMDLEGAELGALRGALAVLPRCDAIIFEQLPGEEPGAAEFLQQQGFQLRPLGPNDMLATRQPLA